jgi:sporulation protein YlmC with PRC-barrel domain
MKQGQVRFEDLVGRLVRNSFGRPIGRIEDLRVEPNGEDYEVTEYLLGPERRLPRLLAWLGQLPTLRALRIGRARRQRPLPWQWIDLTDPERPVLTESAGKDGR